MPYKNKKNQTKHYILNKESYRFRNMKNKFGLSRDDFFNLLEKQNGKCALCSEPFKGLTRNLHVDHDHNTNKVRGLLCMSCNVGLGMLGDNAEGLTKALKYIKGELN